MLDLTDSQLLRYARNILLPQIDIVGQQKLLTSRVAVVGAGGLGSPVLQYLAAAGVGSLSIIDDDVVDESNLQRQVIHSSANVGVEKTVSAERYINSLNPDVSVKLINEKLSASNAESMLVDIDLIVVGTDNFISRYAVNDVCRQKRIPLVSGAAIGFSGQVTSFDFAQPSAPCLRCLYPNGEDDELSCATAGVLGPTVGVMGSLMAMEVIKILTSAGKPLFGRLLNWDALNMEWQTFSYAQSLSCACSNKRD